MHNISFYIWFIGIPVLFLLVVLYVFRPGAKRGYRRDANIPFKNEKDKNN
jgi:cbb3-type cytochrome oxidase subunit 3